MISIRKMDKIREFVKTAPKNGTYVICPLLQSTKRASAILLTRSYITKVVEQYNGDLSYRTKMINGDLAVAFFLDNPKEEYKNKIACDKTEFIEIINNVTVLEFINAVKDTVSTDTLFRFFYGSFSFTNREMRNVLANLNREIEFDDE